MIFRLRFSYGFIFFTKTKLYKGFLPHGKIPITVTFIHSTNSYCYWQWDGSCFTYFVQLSTYSTRFHCKSKSSHAENQPTVHWSKAHDKVSIYVHEILVNSWLGAHVMVFVNWPTLIPALIPNQFIWYYAEVFTLHSNSDSHWNPWLGVESRSRQVLKSQLTDQCLRSFTVCEIFPWYGTLSKLTTTMFFVHCGHYCAKHILQNKKETHGIISQVR